MTPIYREDRVNETVRANAVTLGAPVSQKGVLHQKVTLMYRRVHETVRANAVTTDGSFPLKSDSYVP